MPFGEDVDERPVEIKDLPERLRQARKERGLTLAEVGQRRDEAYGQCP